MQKLCRVHRISDSKLFYILSDRIDGMLDGQYLIDSINKIYVIYQGYPLPVKDGGTPEGEVWRIEASNDISIQTKRPTDDFKHMVKKTDVTECKIKVQNGGRGVAMNNKNKIMIKRVW